VGEQYRAVNGGRTPGTTRGCNVSQKVRSCGDKKRTENSTENRLPLALWRGKGGGGSKVSKANNSAGGGWKPA